MTSMLPWTLKYAPSQASLIPGRAKIVGKLKDFVSNYAQSKKKAYLLYGPSGVGKTSLINALAKELDAELFELNASDTRNKDAMHEILLPVVTTRSFFSANKIILLDEIDGLSGSDDRGGVNALKDIIERSKFPIIMTANDGHSDKIKAVRKISAVVEVEPLSAGDLVSILEHICRQENIVADNIVLQLIARKNSCDIRGAINDLELLSITKTITRDNVLALEERMKQQSMEQALIKIFKTTDPNIARSAFDDVTEDVDDWMSWMEYNVAKEYTGQLDLARAFGMISRADVFKGRIRRRQHWRLLVYIIDLLTAGVAIAKDAPYKTPPDYKESSRPLKIWMVNNQVAKKKSIASKIAEHTHTSTRNVMRNFGYYKNVCAIRGVQESLGLDDEEIAWLAKS